MVDLVRIGEETGDVPGSLNNLADTYESELQIGLRVMTQLIEPMHDHRHGHHRWLFADQHSAAVVPTDFQNPYLIEISDERGSFKIFPAVGSPATGLLKIIPTCLHAD